MCSVNSNGDRDGTFLLGFTLNPVLTVTCKNNKDIKHYYLYFITVYVETQLEKTYKTSCVIIERKEKFT